jgi:hypothetical protein
MPTSLELPAVAPLYWAIQTCQLLLERFIEQFVAMLTQKEKQFGFTNLFDNLLFLLTQLDWGLPGLWLHVCPPHPLLGSIMFLELIIPGLFCQSHPYHLDQAALEIRRASMVQYLPLKK